MKFYVVRSDLQCGEGVVKSMMGLFTRKVGPLGPLLGNSRSIALRLRFARAWGHAVCGPTAARYYPVGVPFTAFIQWIGFRTSMQPGGRNLPSQVSRLHSGMEP
jgi:hypothetical protein